MVKSIITTVAAAALICAYTSSAASTPDDADGAQTLLRKSTRNLEETAEVIAANPDPLTVYEQMMSTQGMERDLQNVRRGNKGPRPTAAGGTNTNNNNNNNENQFVRTVNDDILDGGCFANPTRCGCEHLMHADYRGSQSTTTSGHKCKAWSQAHNFPGEGLEDGPFCRNPLGAGEGAFCFVEDNFAGVHWEYCKVPTCSTLTEGTRTFSEVSSTNSAIGVPGCVSREELINLEFEVEDLLDNLMNPFEKSFHLGGIIRLVAHDFMDFDMHASNQMGADGCLNWDHKNNRGLREIWHPGTPWYDLKQTKHPNMSNPDFWIACAMLVIKLASGGKHDMVHTFLWGRQEASSCSGSGDRLPKGESCKDNQEVFIDRMGLTWKDATALLGAHTVGRGQNELSGHHGTWMPSTEKAMIWDKGFYVEMVQRAWAPRNEGKDNADFMAGPAQSQFPKMMLNTDICLAFDIDTVADNKCCTNINMINPANGQNRCGIYETNQCKRIDSTHPRAESAQAVLEFLGGNTPNNDSTRWYRAFTEAWTKATINGHNELWPVQQRCN
ncbi:heme-dependent peroxidase [Skeletonema marinoi]|uniref:Heme-dependent peroxidase n=1 Tax=Skeletonema marinoi TaxID=267567 RepID=A0AAD8YNG3_9STRA|nr:heme-dependent peroxidase [Skeletonema marinoi]